MTNILEWTHIPIDQPAPYGVFYLILMSIGLPIPLYLSWKSRKLDSASHHKILAGLGIFLILSEIYKQLFHYYILHNQQYDWWIFPWQLCSIPMYLTPFLPILKNTKWLIRIETFLMDFSLLGAVMALAVPDGLLHDNLSLTLHSFIWHFILLYIGLSLALAKRGDTSRQGFYNTFPIYIPSIIIAILLNIIFHSYGNINMFYLSPYQITTQPVFHDIAVAYGIPFSNILYICSMTLGALLCHYLIGLYRKHYVIPG